MIMQINVWETKSLNHSGQQITEVNFGLYQPCSIALSFPDHSCVVYKTNIWKIWALSKYMLLHVVWWNISIAEVKAFNYHYNKGITTLESMVDQMFQSLWKRLAKNK